MKADFMALERALLWERRTGGTMMTPERMVIELHLTPQRFAALPLALRKVFRAYRATYSVLVRHNLFPSKRTTWDKWLAEYRAIVRSGWHPRRR